MKQRRPSLLMLLGVVALAMGLLGISLACPGSSGDRSGRPGDDGEIIDLPSDGGPGTDGDGSAPMAPDGGGPDAQVPFGLDVRPANPTCVAPPRPPDPAGATVTRAFPELSFTQPLFALQAPGDSRRIYVVERVGRVRVFDKDATPPVSSVFVDISGRVNVEHDETGLLGMAFHPAFATNGQVFLSYVGNNAMGGLRTFIVRYRSPDGGATLDPASAEVVLEQDQPFSTHNGGHLAFGPDGFLYFAFGDGGGRMDPNRTAQNPELLLGKMLRLDVDSARPYAIPPTNPYATVGGRKEIYATGFRNPWRWSFDRSTGALWLGDVGEKLLEEINRVELGGNFGWSILEGTECARGSGCKPTGLTPPVAVYGRAEGVSVTGGYVYRGTAVPALAGKYVFGDFGSGRIWTLPGDALPGAAAAPQLLATTALSISSFAELNDGELLVLDFAGGGLHRIHASLPAAPGGEAFPTLLSATGCADPTNPNLPSAGLIPYGVNAPLWSDGAQKERFLGVPDGAVMTVGPEGVLDAPPGTVTVKTFLLGGKRVETRLFMRHPDGIWAGYTYEWNEAGTDATLLETGKVKPVGTQTWTYPSRGECMQCHTAAAGFVLGLEVAQLNGDYTYPGGRIASQLRTLEHIGVLKLSAPVEQLPRMPAYAGPEPVETRARAYLHANCAVCHRPNGLGRGELDLRFSTSLAATKICGVAPEHGELGVAGAMLVAPGDPLKSVLSRRMHSLSTPRMPPLASAVKDKEGTGLVDAWITSLPACPAGP
ncbi:MULTISPECIES: SO2930 family diheme c-type cytochrome [Myxococcus]|uniref:SO2930 family diheme c-type cytochrome n=1 Tax=Myxococcus TaxID=32 RepID=UPI001C11811C|nr:MULTISPECIES: SO2930 family diheme c-type cytochrome [Myxococcus]